MIGELVTARGTRRAHALARGSRGVSRLGILDRVHSYSVSGQTKITTIDVIKT